MRGFLWIFLAFFSLLLCGCASSKQGAYASLKLRQDISILPKLKSLYQPNASTFKAKFFYAWHFKGKKPDEKAVFWAFDGYLSNDYYFFNKQKIPLNFFEKAIANANTQAFFTLKQKAIITQNTFLKNLPVQTAILKDPFKQSEGVPFDYALDSVLNFASPVLISHFTLDKRYAFVLSEAGWGFVNASHLQRLTNSAAQSYENSNFITPLRERMGVYDEKGDFVFEARIGAIYPYETFANGVYYGRVGDISYQIPLNSGVLSKISKQNGLQNGVSNGVASNGVLLNGAFLNGTQKSLQNSTLNETASENVAEFPLFWENSNAKRLIKELLNRPYGWGGYDFERDCSALLRDFYAPFGLYLPRNSLAQSASFGEKFDISHLNNAQKAHFIARYGKPYETLLYLKGHIMLFVGVVGKENAAFHAAWGVRTKDEGRLLIAKSAFTRLDIGNGDSRVSKEDLLISRLESISILNLTAQEKQRIERALSSKKF